MHAIQESIGRIMDDKTFLYHPLNVPKAFGQHIWIVDGPRISMAAYGTSIPFPTRMTVVRLSCGALWLHSPIAWTETLHLALKKLGSVRYLIAPNKLHYASLKEWSDRYPDAQVWCAPGIEKRASAQGIKLPAQCRQFELEKPTWSSQVDWTLVKGSRFMDEAVFFHVESKTLILTDLIENFEAEKLPLLLRWGARMADCLSPVGKMPIDLRLLYMGRKSLAKPALEKMKAWNAGKIIISHGKCISEKADQYLLEAFKWLGWQSIKVNSKAEYTNKAS